MSAICTDVDSTEFLEALDLTVPGLAEVERCVGVGDTAGAAAAFADYLRGRMSVPPILDPGDQRCAPRDPSRAEDILKGAIRVIRYTHQFAEGEIDWLFNATAGRTDVAMTPEWQWQLNRMLFWPDLADAYAVSGDERYAQAWVRQLRSWARQAPVPLNGERHNCWRTLDAGLRMSGAWPHAYHLFVRSPSVRDEDLCLFARLCLDHGRYLLRSRNRWPNQLAMEMEGLYAVGCLFPEFREASAWRARAVEVMHHQLAEQFLPDGAHVELSTSYHNVALDSALKIARWARLCGRLAELPDDYLLRTQRAFDFDLYFMTPERQLPLVNDAWVWNAQSALRAAAQWFPHRPEFAWVASDGQTGRVPERMSHYFPYAGFAVMRGGWGRSDNLLVFDVGPVGQHHAHEDKLQVLLWCYGRQVLFDGGGGIYERSAFRDYAVLSHSHNTAIVDGLSQRRIHRDSSDRISRTPIDARWHSDGRSDFAEGVYDACYGKQQARPARHMRQVRYLRPDVYVVWDELQSLDGAEHDYEVRWHLDSVHTQRDSRFDAMVTCDPGQPNLLVLPLLREGMECRSAAAQTEPELLGWRIDKSGQHAATTVCHRRRGLRGQFLTLLLPLEPGCARSARQLKRLGDVVEVELSDGRRLRIGVPTGDRPHLQVEASQ